MYESGAPLTPDGGFVAVPGDGWEPVLAWDVDDVLNGRVDASEILSDCVAGAPGAGRVVMLAEIDAASLDESAQLDYLAALEKQLRWLQARRVETLAAIAEGDTSEDHWSIVEVARVLNLADPQTGSLMADAAALVDGLPATIEAFRTGEISDRAAAAVLETARTLETDQWAPLEAAVLTRAPRQTVAGLRRSLQRAALRLDPENARKRQRLAHADRHVRCRPLPDGMAELIAVLPAADIRAMWTRLDAATMLLAPSDTRSVDQQRADLLVDAVLSGLPHGALPEAQGRRPSVNVVIDLTTLVRMNEEPGYLAGYGAIPAEVARKLAADASAEWRRFVTDPVTGHLLDYGTATYRPPAALRNFIINRSPECVHPGCSRPAYRCELDHRRPHDRGGPTAAANMFPLCKRHHLAKTHGGWRYRQDASGELIFTSPTGRSYQGDYDPRWRGSDEPPVDGPAKDTGESGGPFADTVVDRFESVGGAETSDKDPHDLPPAVTQDERNAQRFREQQRNEACESIVYPATPAGEPSRRAAMANQDGPQADCQNGRPDAAPPF